MKNIDDFDKSISNFLMVVECLLDARRIKFFERAVRQFVKPGDLVVDGGTGTGIIALFAARQKAKVFAVERDPVIAAIAKRNVEENGLANQITVVNQDIRHFRLPGKKAANVVVMEMLDTGMVAEQQAQAVIALRQNGVITEQTVLLPGKMDCQVRAVDYDFDFYGFKMPIVVQARNYGAVARIKKRYSELVSYAKLDLGSLEQTLIAARVEVPINANGVINAVELKSAIYLGNRRYSDTSDMNMPVIIPIKKRAVKEGEVLKLQISYNMGHGFAEFKLV